MSRRYARGLSVFILAWAVSVASGGLGDLLNKANEANSQAQQAQQDANTAQQTAKSLKRNKKDKQQKPDASNPASNGQKTSDSSKPGDPQPLNGKVTEKLLGLQVSNGENCRMAISDDGQHVMLVNPKGSRSVMMVDGMAGPVFDEIASNGPSALAAAFSPDGKHYAYVGHRGNDFIPVVDGKEQPSIADASKFPGVFPIGLQKDRAVIYSNDGHLAYVSSSGSNENGNSATYQIVLDGKAGEPYMAIENVMFINNKMVYIASTDGKAYQIFTDGKALPIVVNGNGLQFNFSPNGQHYVCNSNGNLIADGAAVTPSDKAPGLITNAMIGDDARVAYILAEDDHQGRKSTLYVSGKPIAQADSFNADYPQLTGVSALAQRPSRLAAALSADGKRMGYITRSSTGQTAVIDGKPGLQYDRIENLQFSPDSKHYFYVGEKHITTYIVYDGNEMDEPYRAGLQFGPNGTHWIYQSWKDSKAKLIVDGKASDPFGEIAQTSIAFSPDGNHFAYSASPAYQHSVVVIDGKSKEIGASGSFSQPNGRNMQAWSDIQYSPDSQHIAYIGKLLNGTGQEALILDDKSFYQGSGALSYPSFTPDGKHFSVITSQNQIVNGVGHTVIGPIIDSKMGPGYESIVSTHFKAAGFIDNHTYSFLGVKDKSIYRVTIDIGG